MTVREAIVDTAGAGSIDLILKTLGNMRMVDLAPKLERGIPRWPTHPHLTIDKAVTHDHDGYYCQAIMMAEHTGAHVDAPSAYHTGWTAPSTRSRRTISSPRPCSISAIATSSPATLITADMLEAYEAKSGIKSAPRAKSLSSITAGCGLPWRRNSKAQWYVMNAPGMSEDACGYFRKRKVKAVATDTVAGETAIIDGVQNNPRQAGCRGIDHRDADQPRAEPLRSLFLAHAAEHRRGSGSPIRPWRSAPTEPVSPWRDGRRASPGWLSRIADRPGRGITNTTRSSRWTSRARLPSSPPAPQVSAA